MEKPNYSKMSFQEKLLHLSKPISIKFRIGQGIGKYNMVGTKKEYETYTVLAYINARDCMDRLDQIFGGDHMNSYKEIAGKAYAEVSLYDGVKWITRSDVGEPTAVAKNKGEASDGFKRACVHFGLGRFLYTIPTFYITSEEMKTTKNITSFIKKKYREELEVWAEKFDVKINEILGASQYNDDGDEPDDTVPEGDGIENISGSFKPSTRKKQ